MVRSIGVDPFKMVYFMEEEFGKVTMQNRVMNPSIERIVKAYIDHYTDGEYDTVGQFAMRQTNVTIDDKPTYGLVFTTGIVPHFTLPLPFILYVPHTIYPRGTFIILEDAFGMVLSDLHSVFDEDLVLERTLPSDYEILNRWKEGEMYEQGVEVWSAFVQRWTIDRLILFFRTMLDQTTYSHFKWHHYTISPSETVPAVYRSGFRGEPESMVEIPFIDATMGQGFSLLTSYVHLADVLAFASIRRLLRTFNPGLVDDKKGFDRKVTRRLLAQHLYDTVYSSGKEAKTGYDNSRLSLIAKPVDTMIRYMDLFDSDSFQFLMLEEKFLEYARLIDTIKEELKEGGKQECRF